MKKIFFILVLLLSMQSVTVMAQVTPKTVLQINGGYMGGAMVVGDRDGWVSSDTALGMMKDNYCNKYADGVVIMEQDLLRAIACVAFDE